MSLDTSFSSTTSSSLGNELLDYSTTSVSTNNSDCPTSPSASPLLDDSFLSPSPSPSPLPQLSSLPHSGSLQIIFGPMFSGKTTELLRRVRRYEYARKRCLVIKYSLDTRYDVDSAATHDKVTMSAVSVKTLSMVSEDRLRHVDVVAIDEGQFFPDVVEFCENHANQGRIVMVAALDSTFERKPFGNILSLVPLAEHICKLNAVCMACGMDGSFTQRLGSEMGIEIIGGADKYQSVCRKCFFKEGQHSPQQGATAETVSKDATPTKEKSVQGVGTRKEIPLDEFTV